MRSRIVTSVGLALGLLAGVALSLAPSAEASRNSVGTYTLPAGNPVVSGQVISSAWANSTLSDLGAEMTNSVDKNGRTAMLAPLPLSSGTSSAPALTFSAEPGTGLYRAGAGDVRMQVSAVQSQKWTSAGATLPGTLGVGGTLAVTGATTLAGGLAVTSGNVAVTGSIASTVTSGAVGLSASNGTDSTVGLVPVGSGEGRVATDFAGRWLSFADDVGSTRAAIIRNGRLVMGNTTASDQGTAAVVGSASANIGGDLWLVNSAAGATSNSSAVSFSVDGTTDATPNARIAGVNTGSGVTDLYFQTYDGTSLATRAIIPATGYISSKGLTLNNGAGFPSGTSLATCNATTHGRLQPASTQVGGNFPETLCLCINDGTSYYWRNMATGATGTTTTCIN